ncbi:MAG: cyanophycin synthetase, partial [Thermoplasmata archaeon]|nr:cyanophycin synthetase [Thermoplasmata archaeon]
GKLEKSSSNTVPGFRKDLEEMMPSIIEHRCSPGKRGGFLQRVEEGTWAGHIVEHLALELQCLAKMEVGFGKTRETDKKGVYTIVYRYRDESAGIRAGEMAVKIVESLFKGKKKDLKPMIEELKAIREENLLGPSTESIAKEADSRGIPVIRLNTNSYVQLGHGMYQRRIQATLMDNTSAIGVEIADDKEQTKEILESVGVLVPKGHAFKELESAIEFAEDVGYPVVVKPLVGHHGKGITTNILDVGHLRSAFKSAKKFHDHVLVERFLKGMDHRMLVIDHKFVAAARREPASVTGDGRSTVKKLINEINSDPRRGFGHEKVLTRIKVDFMTNRLLKQNGLTLDSVIKKGKTVFLKSTANLSTGGVAIDVTDEVHPPIKRMAERVSKLIDINVMGIDVVAPDLTRPLADSGGGIVEVNAAPGFRMHLDPYKGTPRNVAAPFVDMLFPPGSQVTIPIIAVTGTNGKTTTIRLIAHILKYAGKKVGMCCTDGVEVNNQIIVKGDYSGPGGAHFVLEEPTIDHAVLEVARGGIIRRGLGYDESDVGVFLNVSSDHLGEGGITSLDDLAELKSIVVETVKDSGTAVLNADDERVVRYKEKISAKSILFSLDSSNKRLSEHVAEGGTVVTTMGNEIVIRKGKLVSVIADLADMPVTFGGKAVFNVANCLAAVSATHALRINLKDIQMGLVTFHPSTGQLPGRMNVIDMGRYKVLIDYGHNSSAIEALSQILPYLSDGTWINVAGGTGNRLDKDIIGFGEAVARIYDKIIISDPDRRHRKIGETAELVKKGVLSTGFPEEHVQIVLDDNKAIKTALGMAKEGDLVVIQADNIQEILHDIMAMRKKLVGADGVHGTKHHTKKKRSENKED